MHLPDGSAAANAMATCLHLVTGPDPKALELCLAHADSGDAVLFLDTGVLQLLDLGSDELAGFRAELHFAAPDLGAHALLELAGRLGVSVVDDDGFCALLAAHVHCLTWT